MDASRRPGGKETRFWRVAIVEDHQLQRQGVQAVLDQQPGMRVVASHATVPEFTQWLDRATAEQRPHLLVLDLQTDRGPNTDATVVRGLLESGIRVLVLSALTSPALVRAMLDVGVNGFVAKRDPVADLVAAVRQLIAGESWRSPELDRVLDERSRPSLSIQEERVLVLYASGRTLGTVAAELGIRQDTAKGYLDRVKAKYAALGRPVRTKLEMHRAAVADGYLDPSRPL